MRILLDLIHKLTIVCVLFAAKMAFGCDQIPAGQSLWIRLAAPVSTYTAKTGDSVHAVLTQDLVCDNDIILPMGAHVEGIVRSKRKVGWGILHETAALELEFDRATARPGVDLTLNTRVEEVENAREQVKKGVVQGIRSSDTFQGTINSRLIHLPTWNPYSDPFLIAYKAVFPIFPEPEIYYPAGTDIRLLTTKQVECPQLSIITAQDSVSPPKEEADAAAKTSSDIAYEAESEKLDQLVEQIPYRVTTIKHVNADLLNIVFLGTQDQVTSAFREAGWHNADQVSRHTVMKNLYALLNNSGYEQEPMMTFLLNGKPEDMNWQKSLNSYGRRDHLRIWQWPSTTADADSPIDPGQPSVWISSSTHDTGAVLAVKYKGFVHHISPDIDDERSTVIRDLNFAGCVRSITYVSRPDIPTTAYNATGDVMHTDGSIAVVALQNCHPAYPELDSNSKGGLAYRPGNYVFRFIRRQLLTFRNDIFRANIIYGTYDATRRTVLALRNPRPTLKPEAASASRPEIPPATKPIVGTE